MMGIYARTLMIATRLDQPEVSVAPRRRVRRWLPRLGRPHPETDSRGC
jgi:hypothetical protein